KRSRAVSFDHLVGSREQRSWHIDVKRLRRDQVNDEIEFGWLLDWDVGRFRAAQNLVDIIGRTPKQVGVIRSEGHQPSTFDILPSPVYGWQPRADRQDIDWNSVATHKPVDTDINRLAAPLDCIEGGCDVPRAPDLEGVYFKTKRTGCCPNLGQLQYG